MTHPRIGDPLRPTYPNAGEGGLQGTPHPFECGCRGGGSLGSNLSHVGVGHKGDRPSSTVVTEVGESSVIHSNMEEDGSRGILPPHGHLCKGGSGSLENLTTTHRGDFLSLPLHFFLFFYFKRYVNMKRIYMSELISLMWLFVDMTKTLLVFFYIRLME
jgi:hypothetical protein